MQLRLAVAAAALAGHLSGPTLVAAEPSGCRPPFEPYAPSITPAIESGWGEPVHGLSILAATNADSVRLGARLQVEVFFRFDPFESDGRARVLPRSRSEDWTILLMGAGGVHVRPAYDLGFPMVWGDLVELRYGRFHSTSRMFHLLSSDGRQVPAGGYAACIRYGSEPERLSSRRGTGAADPVDTWQGEITTGTFPLEILPCDGDTTLCRLPARVLLESRDGLLAWRWDESSVESVQVVSRPGYAVGFKYQVHAFVLAAAADSLPASTPRDLLEEIHRLRGGTDMSGWGSPAVLSGGMHVLTRRAIAGLLNERRRLHLRATAMIFESSAQSRHLWRPERGDYRVLEQREITATWP